MSAQCTPEREHEQN